MEENEIGSTKNTQLIQEPETETITESVSEIVSETLAACIVDLIDETAEKMKNLSDREKAAIILKALI